MTLEEPPEEAFSKKRAHIYLHEGPLEEIDALRRCVEIETSEQQVSAEHWRRHSTCLGHDCRDLDGSPPAGSCQGANLRDAAAGQASSCAKSSGYLLGSASRRLKG